MESTSPPQPHLEWLDEDGVEAIHDASMRVVETLGIQLGHQRARDLVTEHGGSVDENGVATLPRAVVESAVERAPASFTLHARNQGNDVTVGGDGPPVRAPSYGPSVVRTANGDRRDAELADYETLVKLAHTTEAITCAGYNNCEPTDADPADRHLAMLERSLTLSDKPVMGPTQGSERAQDCMEMVGIATGDPELAKPVVAGLINTVPPRRIGTEMLGGLLTYADHGQPLVASSFTMAGASGPSDLASSMVQANAENLVAITLAQLVTPGTPVVYGVPSTRVHARYGSLSIGTPASALFAGFAGQMARYYGLPSRGGGTLSDAKAVDYQSGFESTLVAAATSFGGVDFVMNAAGVLESYSAVSMEKFVLDCEVLESLDSLRRGVRVDAESISLDRIAAAEPGGHFVDDSAEDRRGYEPSVFDKRAHEAWAEDGCKSAVELGQDTVQARLEGYERPPMEDATREALEAYVDSHTT